MTLVRQPSMWLSRQPSVMTAIKVSVHLTTGITHFVQVLQEVIIIDGINNELFGPAGREEDGPHITGDPTECTPRAAEGSGWGRGTQ